MRLRAFRDADLQGAMAQVRANLGADALILATRRVSGGVEVTAALDEADHAPPAPPPVAKAAGSRPAPATVSTSAGASGETARLSQLDWHGVPLALARRLRAGPLAFALSLAVRFDTLDLSPGSAPVLLAGPPGAGKTLTVARLATRLVMAGLEPLVIGADAERAGAAEQLAAFTRLLGLQLLEAAGPEEVASLLARRRDRQPVLIDTPGGDPLSPAGALQLAALARAAGGRIVAVLPAGLDPAESADLAAAYAAIGATMLVATRLDVARRLGGVLAAASHLRLAEAGIGPGAADGLVAATPDLIARRLLAAPQRHAAPAATAASQSPGGRR